ncbi:MAG: response regulator [Chloroflexi bacterium]|nr:response regulator [Chloroflexota bacterium]
MATENTESARIPGQKVNIILVVEDDKRTSRLERVVLEEGYSVACAGSGEEALKMLPAIAPSLVLLDIALPQMDGFCTFQKIRETSQVPIIMVAAEDRDEDMVRGLEMGADDYITRPFSTNVLAARVKAVLRRTNAGQSKTVVATPGGPEPGVSFPKEPEETAVSSTEEALADAGGRFEAKSKNSRDGYVDSANGVGPSPTASEENYEGAVKLVVETTGTIKNMVQFVDSLRENPQFHLLRMISNARRDGMDVWIRLRSPEPLRTTLLATAGVSKVRAVESSEFDPETGVEMPILKVSLD